MLGSGGSEWLLGPRISLGCEMKKAAMGASRRNSLCISPWPLPCIPSFRFPLVLGSPTRASGNSSSCLYFRSIQIFSPPSLIKWYFPERSKSLSGRRKRGKRGISSAHSFSHCRGKPGWLTKLVLPEVAHLPSWALSPAGLSVLSAAAADPTAGAACRHPAALGQGQRTNGEGQGEGSFEIIYKHITKFHYFCFADSSTQKYKSSRIAPAPAPLRHLGLTPWFRAPRAQRHSGPGWSLGAEGCPGFSGAFGSI